MNLATSGRWALDQQGRYDLKQSTPGWMNTGSKTQWTATDIATSCGPLTESTSAIAPRSETQNPRAKQQVQARAHTAPCPVEVTT